MARETDLLYDAAKAAWNVECRLDTLVELLSEGGEYGGFTVQWVRERQNDLRPIFEGLSQAAGILHAVIYEMENK
jgi:hypothetical protein